MFLPFLLHFHSVSFCASILYTNTGSGAIISSYCRSSSLIERACTRHEHCPSFSVCMHMTIVRSICRSYPSITRTHTKIYIEPSIRTHACMRIAFRHSNRAASSTIKQNMSLVHVSLSIGTVLRIVVRVSEYSFTERTFEWVALYRFIAGPKEMFGLWKN